MIDEQPLTFPTPHDHRQMKAGTTFVHIGAGKVLCETPAPALVCACGYFSLAWPESLIVTWEEGDAHASKD